MSSETAKTTHSADSDRHSLVAHSDTHLSLATTDGGEMNGANLSEWIKALKEMQERNTEFKEWIDAISKLQYVCQDWLNSHSEWAREIDIVFHSEPRSLSMYVILPSDRVTLETRRSVSLFGLAVGGAFRIRCEARLAHDRVDGSMVIQTSCQPVASTPSA